MKDRLNRFVIELNMSGACFPIVFFP